MLRYAAALELAGLSLLLAACGASGPAPASATPTAAVTPAVAATAAPSVAPSAAPISVAPTAPSASPLVIAIPTPAGTVPVEGGSMDVIAVTPTTLTVLDACNSFDANKKCVAAQLVVRFDSKTVFNNHQLVNVSSIGQLTHVQPGAKGILVQYYKDSFDSATGTWLAAKIGE